MSTLPWQERVNERLQALVARAYEQAPAVRSKLDRAGVAPGDIRGLDDLQRLPVTTKDELVRLQAEDPPFGGFCTRPLEELEHVFVSPGPLYDPGGGAGWASAWFGDLLAAFGVVPGERALNAFAYHLVPAGLALDQALRGLDLCVVPAGTGNTDIQARALRDLGVSLFCGTPSFLVKLLRRAEDLGYELRLRHAVLGGEAFPRAAREELARRAITPIQVYGTADVGIIACACPQGTGLHVSDEAAVEIVDPSSGRRRAPGETGEVVVTPFNDVYPLVRFGTGDLAFLLAEPCPCGRAAPLLSRLTGRVGGAVKVRGMFLYPHQVDEVFATLEGVGRYQVVVRREGHRDELVVRVEADEGTDDGPPAADELRLRMQSLWRVRPDRVETVPAGALDAGAAVLIDERPWDG